MIDQNHSGPTEFGDDRRSFAWWSHEPNGRALFFVHGLGGKSIKTWGGFPKALLADSIFTGFDLFFFGYESRNAQAHASALYLFRWLDPLLSAPAEIANRFLDDSERRAASFNYEEVILVVHSLGAPVARRAQLIANKKRRPWLAKTRIVCFAPAHKGSSVPQYLDELNGPLLNIGRAVLKIQCPVLEDLKVGSDFLNRLHDDVGAVLKYGFEDQFVAKRVIFGQLDKFVPVEPPFQKDPDAMQIVNCGHSKVCKPRPGWMEPYDHLRASI